VGTLLSFIEGIVGIVGSFIGGDEFDADDCVPLGCAAVGGADRSIHLAGRPGPASAWVAEASRSRPLYALT
jgi:hypothetical protein